QVDTELLSNLQPRDSAALDEEAPAFGSNTSSDRRALGLEHGRQTHSDAEASKPSVSLPLLLTSNQSIDSVVAMFGPAQYPLAVGDGGDAEELEVEAALHPDHRDSRVPSLQWRVGRGFLRKPLANGPERDHIPQVPRPLQQIALAEYRDPLVDEIAKWVGLVAFIL
ncbi:hypothetical protein FRC04_005979, partial [Tulasnella sp. 424]